MDIIPSNKKNGEKLSHQGYLYTKQIKRSSGIRWRCVERKLGCKGAVRTKCIDNEEEKEGDAKTSNDIQPKREVVTTAALYSKRTRFPFPSPLILKEHNHEPKPEKVEAAKARAQMKMIAQSGLGKPQQILDCCRDSLSEGARMLLPSTESCKRTIRRSMQRNKPPDDPMFLSTTIIVGKWAKTREPNSERFLLFDNGVGARQRILIFATDKNLELLSQSKRIFMDGNFLPPPNLFRDLFVLHGTIGDEVVPLVFILLESTVGVFNEVFEAINSACEKRKLDFQPGTIHLELCEHSREAFYAVIGIKVTIKCCYSHLLKIFWQEVRDQKLVEMYRDDPAFRRFCGMVVSLSFLPPGEVTAGIGVLRRVAHVAGFNLLQFFDEKFVNGRILDNGRVLPTFPPKQWNFHQEVLHGFPDTRNFPSAWAMPSSRNDDMAASDDGSVYNIWSTIDALQEQQVVTMAKLSTSSVCKKESERTDPMTSIVIDFQENICRLCRGFLDKQMDMEEFLGACGDMIKFNL